MEKIMKIVKMASGKTVIKMSYAEWLELGKQAGWGEAWEKLKGKFTGQPEERIEQPTQQLIQPRTLDDDTVAKMFSEIKKTLPIANNNMANPNSMPKIRDQVQRYMRRNMIQGTVDQAIEALKKTNMWGTDAASPASRREIRQSDKMHGKFQKISLEEFNKNFKF